ncbi:MAG: metallophosphoesterase [Pseudomonadota bacterium]
MLHFKKARPARPRLAKGQRVYAIGDIHGRFDLMKALIQEIKRHWSAGTPGGGRTTLIFLGDVIDRGAQSRECLDLLSRLWGSSGVIFLRGNHEDMMIEAAAGNPAAQIAWLANGGYATLDSFEIDPPRPGEDSIDFAERLTAGVAPEIWRMLHATVHSWRCGDYLFVHAGVEPGVALDRQQERTLLSIRDKFTRSQLWHGAVVVHGHSIVDRVEIHSNRVACDTGAYRTGVLSCICIEDDVITPLYVRSEGG